MKEYELKEVGKILNLLKTMDVWQKVLYCTLDYDVEFTKKSNIYHKWKEASLIIIDERWPSIK